jgi:hypothetical protein
MRLHLLLEVAKTPPQLLRVAIVFSSCTTTVNYTSNKVGNTQRLVGLSGAAIAPNLLVAGIGNIPAEWGFGPGWVAWRPPRVAVRRSAPNMTEYAPCVLWETCMWCRLTVVVRQPHIRPN